MVVVMVWIFKNRFYQIGKHCYNDDFQGQYASLKGHVRCGKNIGRYQELVSDVSNGLLTFPTSGLPYDIFRALATPKKSPSIRVS